MNRMIDSRKIVIAALISLICMSVICYNSLLAKAAADTHGKISISVTVEWAGKPSESAAIILKADGKQAAKTIIKEKNEWSYTFADLDEYKDGKKIEYTVEEEKIDGYKTDITGDTQEGYVIRNAEKSDSASDDPSHKGQIYVTIVVLVLAVACAIYLIKTYKHK